MTYELENGKTVDGDKLDWFSLPSEPQTECAVVCTKTISGEERFVLLKREKIFVQ